MSKESEPRNMVVEKHLGALRGQVSELESYIDQLAGKSQDVAGEAQLKATEVPCFAQTWHGISDELMQLQERVSKCLGTLRELIN